MKTEEIAEKARELFPNYDFGESISQTDEWTGNEIQQLKRDFYVHGYKDGKAGANAEWQEKVRWKDARKEPATKFNKWIEFSCGKGIDNHRFIVFIESKTHFKFYFKYHPNELLWREIIE